MSASDDDELDDILDSALDKFDIKNPSEITDDASSKPALGDPSEKVNDLSAAEALRAFEEALKPLEAGATSSADEEEVDMQLITEFMKSLEPFAGGSARGTSDIGAPTANNAGPVDAPTGIENAIKDLIDNVLSKDILQEPMQQIRNSLRNWLAGQGDNLEPAERERHERQHAIVVDICAEYEKDADSTRVIDLLAKLKDSGPLPPAVMRELPDDGSDNVGGDGMPGIPEDLENLMSNCPVQ